MAQLVAEEMGFQQGWNSPSHTVPTLVTLGIEGVVKTTIFA